MDKKYNILICPLEWGLGHAARMIPLARELQERNYNIIIGSGEEHLSLFRNELPGITCISFTGFKPGYSRFIPQYFSLLLKTPLLLYHIVREHFILKKIIKEYSIDIVISDNRFGLWNRNITSVYVTHMPLIPFPKAMRFLEFTGIFLHRFIIKKYTLCFIPDLPGEQNVSGRLSHGIELPDNVRYTGILSRFSASTQNLTSNPIQFKHNTVILSGPEPQREILKQKLMIILANREPGTVILEGKPNKIKEVLKAGNITFYSHLLSVEMAGMIKSSESIVARSGYTTIMELISLNRSALIIPTPGQTEQEYLAEYLSEKDWFTTIAQNRLDGEISLPSINAIWSEEIIVQSNILLEKALEELSEKHHKKSKPQEPCKKS